MGLFNKHKTDGHQEQGDRLGGFTLYDSDIYQATVRAAWWMKSKDGAEAIHLELDLEGNKKYSQDVYYTNKAGQSTFEKDGNQIPLAGFTLINDLCLVVTEKELCDQDGATEPKVMNVWNPDSKKQEPKEVPVLTGLLGGKVAVGLLKTLQNKEAKGDDGKYRPTGEDIERNEIDKIFHPELRVTIPEVKEAAKESEKTGKQVDPAPKFWEAWLQKNKGNVKDKRKSKGGAAGGPPKAGAAPAQGSGAAAKGLFGKKG